MSRNRNWCFTSFEAEPPQFDVTMKYMIVGKEVCPDTSREHWQGFVIFKNPKLFGGLKRVQPTWHWEAAKGSIDDNVNYCSKDGNFEEHGERPAGSGHRSDLDAITDMIASGKSELEIYETSPSTWIRNYRGIKSACQLLRLNTRRDWIMDVRIYWGKPGSGKTRTVYDEFDTDVYPKMVGKWWDGYMGQRVVLIDDFDPDTCFDNTFDFYLKLLDRYPMLVEWKGGSGNFCSRVIIFTSNVNPNMWFLDKRNRDAFFRRVCTVREF